VISLGNKNLTDLLTNDNENSWVNLGNDYANVFLDIRFNHIQLMNCIRLEEPVQNGQRVKSFSIEILKGGEFMYRLDETTIGHQRILTFPLTSADEIRIFVKDSKSNPLISEIDVYRIDDVLHQETLNAK
jgi:alpha-L-fucosidase